MNERRILTPDVALSLLPEGDSVHVFSNPGVGMLIGADWSRAAAEEAIRSAAIREIGGEACVGMKHGLVVREKADDRRPWFFATRDDVDWKDVETVRSAPLDVPGGSENAAKGGAA